MDETNAVNWCCAAAAQLHKIALDLRFLASRQLVTIGRAAHHAGSSSMPHKTNPYKWEKVCSVCRSISTTQAEIWSVMAQNSLERTLDGSWQIKQLLRRCFHGLALALDELEAVDCKVNFTKNAHEMTIWRDTISSDRDLTRRVVQGGESRWLAYLDLINQQNGGR
jgi:adenylosuccinate lyase